MEIDFGKNGIPENGSLTLKDKSFSIEIYHWGSGDGSTKGVFVILIKNADGKTISRKEIKERAK